MNHPTMSIQELNELFSIIGLKAPNGNDYKERLKKHRQVFDYITHIEKVAKKVSKKKPLHMVDCGCGKAYLSFVANHYIRTVLKRDVRFTCIDYNQGVIRDASIAAEALGFDNMTFICDDIFQVNFDTKPDIVYSLHACNTATDMTIAKGILEGAKHILTVSCCQHHVRNTLSGHPLTAITRHGVYKERIADMVADSMRSLILEAHGYQAKVFDYIPSSETPKNVMIRASRGTMVQHKSIQAMAHYNELKTLFGTEPMLQSMLETQPKVSDESHQLIFV